MNDQHNPAPSVADRGGWRIPEWCARYGIRRGSFYRMEDRPDIIRIGSMPIVTVEADLEWRDRQRAKAKADKASA